MVNPFFTKWGNSTDSQWLSAILKSIKNPVVEGVEFPKFPPIETQRFVHGSASEEISARGAFRFYVETKLAMTKSNLPISDTSRLLDFGTGWGRIIMPFMRDFAPSNIYGVEPSAELCKEARGLNKYVNINQSNHAPPLIFENDNFDCITAYSIFSHLPQEMFAAWFKEFHRILRPNGIVCFTTLGEKLLMELEKESLNSNGDIHFWHKILIDHLPPIPIARDTIRRGEMLFLKTQGTETYGDTFMSTGYIAKTLKSDFCITYSNLSDMAQDFICAQKI